MKIVIIGGGPAGRTAAIELKKSGHSPVLIEKFEVGGTCLNKGCMVINGLSDIAKFLEEYENFKKLGIIENQTSFNYTEMIKRLRLTQKKLIQINRKELLDLDIELIYGNAIINDKFVEVNDETIHYDKLLIATGARPIIPDIDGIENCLTYENILNLDKLPEKIVIIGSGTISAEFAWIFSAMGANVEMVCRSTLLKRLDDNSREYIKKHLLNRIRIHENARIKKISPNCVILDDERITGKILLAAGTQANTESLKDLVKLNDKNEIIVDKFMKTNKKNIYAAGDVIGGIKTTPVARMEGISAAHNIIGEKNKIDYNYIPQTITLKYDVSCIFNDLNQKKDNNNYLTTRMPGLIGSWTFWELLNHNTGLRELEVDITDHDINKLISISPSSRYALSYISMIMRLNQDLVKNFDKYIEPHSSTDNIFKLIKILKNY